MEHRIIGNKFLAELPNLFVAAIGKALRTYSSTDLQNGKEEGALRGMN
jgi:hypothetical protein